MEKIDATRVNNTEGQTRTFMKAVVVLIAVTAVFLLLGRAGRVVLPYLGLQQTYGSYDYEFIKVGSASELEHRLKEFGLWKVGRDASVPAVVFTGYPADLQKRGISDQKRIFFNVLLPAALIAQQEVAGERRILLEIINRLRAKSTVTSFDEQNKAWQRHLSSRQIQFVLKICLKYRSTQPQELLKRVNVIPVSMILAQAAIESAWGRSRFAVDGNNIFGIWTWGGAGMVPARREDGKSHKVAVFDSMLDSVQAYTLMLNRLPAYRTFRKMRADSDDSLVLAGGLNSYSSRGWMYVRDVKVMVRSNNLKIYDSCKLSTSGGWF